MSVRNMGRVNAISEMSVTVSFVRPLCKKDVTTENTSAVLECLSEGTTLQYNTRNAQDETWEQIYSQCKL